MADIYLFAKGGLLILVIVALGFLIEHLTFTGDWGDDDLLESGFKEQMLNTTLTPTVDVIDSTFDETLMKCLKEHSSFNYYPIMQDINISFSCVPEGICLQHILINTNKVLQSLGISLTLIEPSLLFCLLPSSRKFNLLTRGFNKNDVHGLKNVITFGLHYPESKILDEAGTRKKFKSLGYKIIRFTKGMNTHLLKEYPSENLVSHYFLIQYDVVIHLIILYPRDTYLFSSAFNVFEISTKGLQFLKDRAFKNFTTSLVHLNTLSTAPILLPSDARCFLLDSMSSEFLECKDSTSNMMLKQNAEILISLKELKTVLDSQMVTFCLWSKSLQGWYENCDIQHYSQELQFSVAAKSIEGFNFSALFANSSCQHVEVYSDVTKNLRSVEVNCYGVNIHLIFMYEDKVTFWTEHIDTGTTYKLRFPKFTLCSTDIYGEKVTVPCETGEILESEYGQFLKNTTLHLNPKSNQNVFLMEK